MIIVTGTGRCGTSMVMQTLKILGVGVTGEKFSGQNIPECNPKGYYELDPNVINKGIKSNKYKGLAVKMCSTSISNTPDGVIDKIILCVRPAKAVIRSYKKFLELSPTGVKPTIKNARRIYEYNRDLLARRIMGTSKDVLVINFDDMLINTVDNIHKICIFLNIARDTDKIAEAIENIRG